MAKKKPVRKKSTKVSQPKPKIPEPEMSLRIPKQAKPDPNNPEDYIEVGPGEEMPEPYRTAYSNHFWKVMEKPMGDFLAEWELSPDDFDNDDFTLWAKAFLGFMARLPEDVQVVKATTERALKRRLIRQGLTSEQVEHVFAEVHQRQGGTDHGQEEG
jgi:hypothetical protein